MRGVNLITRKAWGARRPCGTTALPFERAHGVAVHHSAGRLGPALRRGHGPACGATVRAFQDFHMAPGGLGAAEGGSDIAYSHVICPHGFTFRGRGAGIRTGANGTTAANDRYYAVCVIGLDELTPAAEAELGAVLDWYRAEFQRAGVPGFRLRPHSDFTSTSCPGNRIRAFLRKRGGR